MSLYKSHPLRKDGYGNLKEVHHALLFLAAVQAAELFFITDLSAVMKNIWTSYLRRCPAEGSHAGDDDKYLL